MELRTLIGEREGIHHDQASLRATICKRIRKLIQKKLALQKEEKIRRILTEFRGLREITSITGPPRKTSIESMKDGHGTAHSSKEGIAEVFAMFYENLYDSKRPSGLQHSRGDTSPAAPPFTTEELLRALRRLKNGKAKDCQGIVAEMLKLGGEKLHESILTVSNDVCKGRQHLRLGKGVA